MPTFLAALKNAGAAEVVRIDAYETTLGREAAAEELLQQLIRTPFEDLAIAFSSIAEVRMQHVLYSKSCMNYDAADQHTLHRSSHSICRAAANLESQADTRVAAGSSASLLAGLSATDTAGVFRPELPDSARSTRTRHSGWCGQRAPQVRIRAHSAGTQTVQSIGLRVEELSVIQRSCGCPRGGFSKKSY